MLLKLPDTRSDQAPIDNASCMHAYHIGYSVGDAEEKGRTRSCMEVPSESAISLPVVWDEKSDFVVSSLGTQTIRSIIGADYHIHENLTLVPLNFNYLQTFETQYLSTTVLPQYYEENLCVRHCSSELYKQLVCSHTRKDRKYMKGHAITEGVQLSL